MADSEGALTRLPKASLIISVYKSAEYLDCILDALCYQTYKDFEVLVSEDGSSCEILSVVKQHRRTANYPLKHVSQPDIGFRKNRALNSAIRLSESDYLIFMDGDCVPHPRFVESHLAQAKIGVVSTGRRVELGSRFSRWLANRPSRIRHLGNSAVYSALLPALLFDRVKNPESGYYSAALHYFAKSRPLSIVGCNFSGPKSVFAHINGFNEDYKAPGIGEDSDIEWRLIRAGVTIANIKFLTPLFHLWHPRSYSFSSENYKIYTQTKGRNQWFAERGLVDSRSGCADEKNTAR